MSIASEVRWVGREAGVLVAEMFYASGGEGLFRRGVVSYGGHGYGTRFTAFRVSTSGKWVVSVLLEENFGAR